MAATGSRRDVASGWAAAVALADRVAAGGQLPTVPSLVVLDSGEVLHADLPAEGWRFHGVDVTYALPHAVAIGGPLMFGVVAAASAVARRRVRHAAEAVAAPRWRPLGVLRILVTDRRLLVWRDGAWASVWYGVVRDLRLELDAGRFDMLFETIRPTAWPGRGCPTLRWS